jgi:hypothetical protein
MHSSVDDRRLQMGPRNEGDKVQDPYIRAVLRVSNRGSGSGPAK